MSNVLNVILQEAIRCLHQKGWGQRRIARELGVHRKTIRSYVEGSSKCTTHSTAGSAVIADSKCTSISTAGSGGDDGQRFQGSVSAEPKPGRQSLCEPFRAVVEAKLEAGLWGPEPWGQALLQLIRTVICDRKRCPASSLWA
jgi:hypothetical protein